MARIDEYNKEAADLAQESLQSSSIVSDNHDDPAKMKDVDLENQAHPIIQSDSDSDGIGRQIELEAGNSIKYRTCSWQKVLLCFACFQCFVILHV